MVRSMQKEIVIPDTDTDFSDHIITSVYGGTIGNTEGDRCFSVTCKEFSLGCPDIGITPKAGDKMRVYPEGRLGSRTRGLCINGVPIYYRTEEEDELDRQKMLLEMEQRKRAEYEANKDKYEATVKTLPKEFQDRIQGFKDRNPNFWEQMGYEVFVCEEAVKVINKIDDIKAFCKLSYEEQNAMVDFSDNHSGNTIGATVFLAMLYKTNPEFVAKAHSAICPLIGCKDAGCWASTQNQKEEVLAS